MHVELQLSRIDTLCLVTPAKFPLLSAAVQPSHDDRARTLLVHFIKTRRSGRKVYAIISICRLL